MPRWGTIEHEKDNVRQAPPLDSRLRGNDGRLVAPVTPIFQGNSSCPTGAPTEHENSGAMVSPIFQTNAGWLTATVSPIFQGRVNRMPREPWYVVFDD